ncbi:MAG: hypothetical protein PHH26_03600 [Candidatus Thermoplasmatota archaeon]|nr:hypothetical protein [Candidatus Thermoplasmatota archaeon]
MYKPIVFRCAKSIEKQVRPALEKRALAPFEAIGEYVCSFYLSFCLIPDAKNRSDVYLGTCLGKSLDAEAVAEIIAVGKNLGIEVREANDRFAGGTDIHEARGKVPAIQFAVNEKISSRAPEFAGAVADLLISRTSKSGLPEFNRKVISNSLSALENDAMSLFDAQKGGARIQVILDEISAEKERTEEIGADGIDPLLAKIEILKKALEKLRTLAKEKQFKNESEKLEEERRRIIADIADLEKMQNEMDAEAYNAEKEGLVFMLKEVERMIKEKKKSG